jgi:putative hydrolase of the HAD superfamily
MRKTSAITCVFVDVGGVLLTNGWDHHARRRAVAKFKLDWAEMEERHRLVFEIHEEGKLTFEEYLSLVVFYEKRPFTRAQFRRFMCEQSKPYPDMIALVAQLKAQHGLKIAVVSNESLELNAYRIRTFGLAGSWIRLFPPASSISASPTRTSSGLRWTSLRHPRIRFCTSKTRPCSSRSRKASG